MKDIDREEFFKRAFEFEQARGIFIKSGLTKNIGHAWEAYQYFLAEEKRALIVSTATHGRRRQTEFDRYPRPVCTVCGEALFFREVPKNEAGIMTQLYCSNRECDRVLNSVLILPGWLNLVKEKTPEYIREILLELPVVSKRDPLPGMIGKTSDRICPGCGLRNMEFVKGCCGASNGYLWCPGCKEEIIL